MNWYYSVLGGHIHVRVFMNGGKCGDLVFRSEEFDIIIDRFYGTKLPLFEWNFIDETPKSTTP